MNYSLIIKYVAVGILTMGLGLSNAWAMTQDEAKALVQQHAAAKHLKAADVSEALTTLKNLIEKNVPVEHAYDVVNTCVEQGIRGKELAEIAKSLEREVAKGVPSDKAAEHARARIQERVQSSHREHGLRDEIASPSKGGAGAGSGSGAGFGGGSPMGGAGQGSGAGSGYGGR